MSMKILHLRNLPFAGPTIGPLVELGVLQPFDAIKRRMEGKESHLLAQSVVDLKGFVPGGNIWYLKAAIEHLVLHQVLNALSPGYLSNIRSRTQREYGQSWWYEPGEILPERAPDLGAAFKD